MTNKKKRDKKKRKKVKRTEYRTKGVDLCKNFISVLV